MSQIGFKFLNESGIEEAKTRSKGEGVRKDDYQGGRMATKASTTTEISTHHRVQPLQQRLIRNYPRELPRCQAAAHICVGLPNHHHHHDCRHFTLKSGWLFPPPPQPSLRSQSESKDIRRSTAKCRAAVSSISSVVRLPACAAAAAGKRNQSRAVAANAYLPLGPQKTEKAKLLMGCCCCCCCLVCNLTTP